MAHYNDEITILVPTWNRRKFLGLFLMNVKNQDYPHEKLNLIIDDDGPEGEKFINNIKEVEEYLHPIKVKYINNKPRRSIGKKRNDLIKECKTKIFCFMDDDDVYFSTYISHSYTVMKNKKVGCVGSDKMVFCMTDKNFDIHAIDCGNRASLIHEATLMMTYKYYRASCKFGDNSAGEGKNIFIGHERSVAITDIMKIMCCVQHGENTIDKLQFAKEENKLNIRLDPECENILKQILFKK
jgi:glycosyltransferase involved in cell wall biosynthesis